MTIEEHLSEIKQYFIEKDDSWVIYATANNFDLFKLYMCRIIDDKVDIDSIGHDLFEEFIRPGMYKTQFREYKEYKDYDPLRNPRVLNLAKELHTYANRC